MTQPLIDTNTTEGSIIVLLMVGAVFFLVYKISNSNYVKNKNKKTIKNAIKYARKKGIKRQRAKPSKPLINFPNPIIVIISLVFIGWIGFIINAFLSMGLFGAFMLGMFFMAAYNNSRN